MSRETALYRLFDEGGRLLYVGISFKPLARIRTHRSQQPWGHEIDEVTVEWLPTRKTAVRSEWDAIRWEAPVHNKQRPSDGASPYLPPPGGWWWAAKPIYMHCPFCELSIGQLEVGVHHEPPNRWVLEVECTLCNEYKYVDSTDDPDVVISAGELGDGWRPRLVVSGG